MALNLDRYNCGGEMEAVTLSLIARRVERIEEIKRNLGGKPGAQSVYGAKEKKSQS